ncbi:MAG: IucA/IucC family C-terminal-domain containing protein [Acidimicrobiales bacterium]
MGDPTKNSHHSPHAANLSLTTLSGEEAASRLGIALSEVGAAVSYLRAEVGERATLPAGSMPTEETWLASSDLVHDPAWLAEVVAATAPRLGTSNQTVATSLFVQNYAYRVITLAVACATVSGVVPDSRHEHLAVAIKAGRPNSIAYLEPRIIVMGGDPETVLSAPETLSRVIDDLVESVITGHLTDLVASAHESVRIGKRLLWGNVAASCAVAFRTMEGLLGPWVRDVGERFMVSTPKSMIGLGSFWLVDEGGTHGWFWERTNCCLYDRLGGVRCADCSKTPASERRAAYRRSLNPQSSR